MFRFLDISGIKNELLAFYLNDNVFTIELELEVRHMCIRSKSWQIQMCVILRVFQLGMEDALPQLLERHLEAEDKLMRSFLRMPAASGQVMLRSLVSQRDQPRTY